MASNLNYQVADKKKDWGMLYELRRLPNRIWKFLWNHDMIKAGKIKF
jgi:hypothetical protein